MERQTVEVDHVHVGLVARREDAAVVESDELRRLLRLHAHESLERKLLSTGPIAPPVLDQRGREARVAEDATMGTAIG